MTGRVVEIKPGLFKAQVRRWWGWQDFCRTVAWLRYPPIAYFNSAEDAARALEAAMKREVHKPRVVQTLHYPEQRKETQNA